MDEMSILPMTHNFDKPCGAENTSNLNMVKLDPKYSSR